MTNRDEEGAELDEEVAPEDDTAPDELREGRPDWWRENERLREAMDLPEYRPPRFSDGTYTHRVTGPLETEHGCRIQFAGVNTRYPEDWAVRIDGEPAFGIGRHRDEQGNTVYELAADEFRTAVVEALVERTG